MRFYARLLLALLWPMPWCGQAGDWMLSEGEQSLYLSLAMTEADSYWNDRRELQQDSCTSHDWRTTLHYEYGYSYYRTLFASTSYERNRCGSETVVGVPELKLGMRGRVDPFRNGYTWELAMILPVNGDRSDRRKPGSGLFGVEAGLFRSYYDDPYQHPFTEITHGIWGWELGTTVWAEGAGLELRGELNWRRRLNDRWRFKTWLGGYYANGNSTSGAGDILSSRKAIDYDKLTCGARFSRKLTRHSSMGLELEQTLWGRNTSQDTSLKLAYSILWD